MQLANLLTELQSIFPADQAAWVLAGLRGDALVWKAVQDDDFFRQAQSRWGAQGQLWSPANLALLALDVNLDVSKLTAEPLAALDNPLRGRALRAFEEALRNGGRPSTLAEAGLLALALRERRRLMGNWNGMLDDLRARDGEASGWETSLACLYGLIPNAEEMIEALAKSDPHGRGISLAGQILFSQPMPVDQREAVFLRLLQKVEAGLQIGWLLELNQHGEADLAARLAECLLENAAQPAVPGAMDLLLPAVTGSAVNQVVGLQQRAGLLRLCRRDEEARGLLAQAEQALKIWQRGVCAAQIDAGDLSLATAWEQHATATQATSPEPLELMAETGLALIDQGEMGCLDHIEDARLTLRKAEKLAHQGLTAEARKLAADAADLLITEGAPLETRLTGRWNAIDAPRILLGLDLKVEALAVCDILQKNRPADEDLIALTGRIQRGLGHVEEALSLARCAVVLQPEAPAFHADLAELYEFNGAWINALAERHQVVELLDQPGRLEWLAVARAALRADQPDQTVAICKDILDTEENDGLATALMGQAQFRLGNLPAASRLLSRATLLSPDMADAWLALAELQEQGGDSQRSLETLRAAALAVPDNAQVYYQLASKCLQMNLFAEALPFLRKAAQLNPESSEVARQLGSTLLSLGHLAEAKTMLVQAHQQWPADSELAYILAQVLIELDDKAAALPALEVALQAGEPAPERYLLYAQTLIEEALTEPTAEPIDLTRLVNAQQALERAVALDPNCFAARLLLADVLRARGEAQAAFNLYHKLEDAPESGLMAWRWRVQSGLGQAALALGQADTAVVALQDAVQIMPENVALQRTLAEALRTANLRRDALRVARQALKLAADDLKNLSWFVQMMIDLGEEGEAVEALHCATQLSPNSADLWIQTAELQIRQGDLDGARQSLKQLMGLDTADAATLQRAAFTYLRLGDRKAALACLERAVGMSTNPGAELLFAVAALKQQNGALAQSLEFLQKAIENHAELPALYIFQADLLSGLFRPQAALACLEHALRLIEANPAGTKLDLLPEDVRIFAPDGWAESVADLCGIHLRFASLLRETGDLPSALQHALSALEVQPENWPVRYLAADLAAGQLNRDLAVKLASEKELPVEGTLMEMRAAAGLQALLAELALERDDTSAAGISIHAGLGISDSHIRVLSAQTRWMIHEGDWSGAEENYTQACRLLEATAPLHSGTGVLEQTLYAELRRGESLWLGEAALDLQRWEAAAHWFEQYTRSNPGETRGQLRYARCLALAAEKQRRYSELGCRAHLPGEASLSEDSFRAFEKAISAAGKVSGSMEVERWRGRGRSAFHPTPQTVRILAGLPGNADDNAALIAALRETHYLPGAIRAAQRFSDSPAVLAELAFCQMQSEPLKGLEAARQAAELSPVDPILAATLALAADRNGQTSTALQAWEAALNLWPDEAEWHARAAGKAIEIQARRIALQHWEHAHDLQPEAAQYAIALGREYLTQGIFEKAVIVLLDACQYNQENAEIWYLLAMAQRANGDLNGALQSAEHACNLDAAAFEPLLLCGQLALGLGQNEIALNYARDAYRRNSQSVEAVLLSGEVLEALGRPEEALALLEQVPPELAEICPVRYQRAELIRQLRGSKAALPYLQEVVRCFPEDIPALSLLALSLQELGDLAGAEQAARQALAVDANLPDMCLLVGKLQRKAGHLDEAIEMLSKTVLLAPDLPEGYLELGQAYSDRREHTQAVRLFKQAIQISPRDHRPYYLAGLVLRENKDYSGAESMLRKASELAPDDINIRRQLGAVITLNLVHNSLEVTQR